MPRKETAKRRGKPFEEGNPGRPRGARHRTTLAIEELLQGEHEKLTRKAIDKALEGDTVALRLCLDRIAPSRKDAAISFDLPPIRTAEDTMSASAAVLAAVAAGEITPDEAGRVMALLVGHRSIVESSDHERRLAQLEANAKK